MDRNEIIAKARALDKEHKSDEIVALLEDYVRENLSDTEAFALYEMHKTYQIIYSIVGFEVSLFESSTDRYKEVMDKDIIQLSELLHTYDIAGLYLSDRPKEEIDLILRGFTRTEIDSLGKHLEDYEAFRAHMDKFYDIHTRYGYQNKFYDNLALIADWRSTISLNIFKYIVEKVSPIVATKTDEEIYNMYVKETGKAVCPFSDKPTLSGGKLVITNIKTTEACEFWKGYFTLLKKIRQEDYDAYTKATSDENSDLYAAYTIGKKIDTYGFNLMYNKVITSRESAEMKVYSNVHTIIVSDSSLKGRVEAAEQSLNTVRVNPIELIKANPIEGIKALFKEKFGKK